MSSRLGLGTHALHRLLSSRARQELLAAAHSLGARYFDTAPSYGLGSTEIELGRFVRSRRRSELVLTSKFGIAGGGGVAARLPGAALFAAVARVAARRLRGRAERRGPMHDFRPEMVGKSVERSLRALQTDYLDVLYLHEPTLAALGQPQALIETLLRLKAGGKVRQIGLAGDPTACRAIAAAHPSLADILQLEIPADADGLPQAGPFASEAGVWFWEFGRTSAGDSAARARTLARLSTAGPSKVVMLSTHRVDELREAFAIIERSASSRSRSATPALA